MQNLSILVKAPIALPAISVKKILSEINLWQARAKMRQQLADLPDYRLEDLGISPEEAFEESKKRFWQK